MNAMEKKDMNAIKRLTSLLCIFALMLILPAAAFAEGSPAASSNINQQDQTSYGGSTVKSYLYENGQGGLTRVEYTGDQVIVEDYDSSFALQNSRVLSMELPVWGGFFAGSNANYVIFGQSNTAEDNSAEVMRVVKYSKDWQRQGQASVMGANTQIPFHAGSLRCAEIDGYLYIRTSHRMYKTSDGLNHQSNMTFQIQESDMTVADSYYDVMNVSVGYISHSFNQFILIDQDHNIIAADHGDSYPRGMILVKYSNKAGDTKFQSECASVAIQSFAGPVGQNKTGASLGGLAETDAGYVIAYNYDGAAGDGPRDVYLGFSAKNSLDSTTTKISPVSGNTTPVMAPIGLDGGYVMWNGKSGDAISDTLYYAAYSSDGSVGDVKTAAAPLSDCQPVFFNGKLVWYVTDKSTPTFYGLDSSGVHVLSGPDFASSTAPATPTTPTLPSDVTAIPNASMVLVNGKQTTFDAYTISGYNYFKLRDLAYVLSGTEKQFEVGWDGEVNSITLTSGKPYTAVGGEISSQDGGNQTAKPTTSKILKDGKEISLTAYSINGNNYFKLRDIGKLFDFGVDWDQSTQTISISTTKGYTA